MVSESEIQTGKITEVVLLALMMTNWQLQLYNVCNENVQCAMTMCNEYVQLQLQFICEPTAFICLIKIF